MLRRYLLICALMLALPAVAGAAPIMVLGPGGHVRRAQDPYLAPAYDFNLGPGQPARSMNHLRRFRARIARAEPTVRSELQRLLNAHRLSVASYRRMRGDFDAALATARRLSGLPASELQSVVTIVHDIAASGQLAPSRIPALALTLERNRQWWSGGPGTGLSSGQRVEFAGSELVWEYYPGRGLALQELGSFGKADGLFTGGAMLLPRARHLLSELIPLATGRGGGLTWEYFFPFDGGNPPWASAMAQGTALEALTRAYRAFGDRSYLALAHRALAVLRLPPPLGVGVPTPAGTRYLLYSFAPGAPVINGFLQTLIGLYDYAQASGDAQAQALFDSGDAEAQRELPKYDTGAWSLYQPGESDTLDYHQVVTGFARSLCDRTGAAVYCDTAQRFAGYLTTPPVLGALSTHLPPGRDRQELRFSLSKPAHVGVVLQRGAQTILSTSADFDGGSGFQVGPLSPGQYSLRFGATDLAGNFSHIAVTLSVS